jgi:hypothetical protein
MISYRFLNPLGDVGVRFEESSAGCHIKVPELELKTRPTGWSLGTRVS